jgi:hypothetical protein
MLCLFNREKGFMATASSSVASSVTLEGVKSCLCGSVQSSISIGGLTGRVRHGGGHKCRFCRTKPRFFLRPQRSLDLGSEEPPTPVEIATPSSSHSSSPARVGVAEPLRRRARSAERYDGMRINGEQPSLELYFGTSVPQKIASQ